MGILSKLLGKTDPFPYSRKYVKQVNGNINIHRFLDQMHTTAKPDFDGELDGVERL